MTTALTTASMTLATAIVCLALATNMLSCEAYAFMRPAVQQQRQQVAKKPVPLTPFMAGPTATSLFSSPEEGEEQQQQDQEVKAEGEQQEEEASEAEEAKQEEEQPPEDPEVVALKEAIADLERTLKEKQSTIQYLKEQAEQYSKSGYARKVAEMETMRRARSSAASSSKETSIANVLRDFLPVIDKLDMLNEKYGEDEFGSKYVALAGNMKTAFSQMGVSEYQVAPGQSIDRSRCLAVEEVYSSEHPKDTIVEALTPGMELKGNVIRLAECVVSLGEEKAEEEEAAAAAEGDEGEGEAPSEEQE